MTRLMHRSGTPSSTTWTPMQSGTLNSLCCYKTLTFSTISFFHDNPEPLVRLQSENWTPLLDWARKTFDVKINVSNSISCAEQPEETKEKLSTVLESLNRWELAGTSYTLL